MFVPCVAVRYCAVMIPAATSCPALGCFFGVADPAARIFAFTAAFALLGFDTTL
jgi:hypothetical protein